MIGVVENKGEVGSCRWGGGGEEEEVGKNRIKGAGGDKKVRWNEIP